MFLQVQCRISLRCYEYLSGNTDRICTPERLQVQSGPELSKTTSDWVAHQQSLLDDEQTMLLQNAMSSDTSQGKIDFNPWNSVRADSFDLDSGCNSEQDQTGQ